MSQSSDNHETIAVNINDYNPLNIAVQLDGFTISVQDIYYKAVRNSVTNA